MINDQVSEITFAFFGSSRLSVIVLDELLKFDLKPSLIVTTPDKPQGRKLEIKPNVVKVWATSHNVPVLDPAKLDANFIERLKKYSIESLEINNWPLFIVASYGKIIPDEIINMPTHKTLNIHPSLLPQYRGASPLPTAILDDTKKTGITIMQIDSEMDHGPIIAQREINITDHFKDWPTYEDFEEMMAKQGAEILAKLIPKWLKGEITPTEQDHSKASYTKKITKEDGKIELTNEQLNDLKLLSTNMAYDIFRKIQAYHEWPQAYFFIEQDNKKIRVKITDASFENEKLSIKKVIPEGKKEMLFADFARGYLSIG